MKVSGPVFGRTSVGLRPWAENTSRGSLHTDCEGLSPLGGHLETFGGPGCHLSALAAVC